MNPQFPVYIVSKGRWESRLTVKALEKLNVSYYIIVEQQEYDNYAQVIEKNKILVLPQKYKQEYVTLDNLGDAKSTGPGPARNFAWDHSVANGHKWHWVMDDNLQYFCRLNRNTKATVTSGTIFKCMEDFVLRYENVAIAGPNYAMFCKCTDKVPAFVLNTRIYSCLLIRNDIPYRWRGRYNEDTDLSLRALKDSWCTVQFNAFLCEKITTQRMTGGNTKDFYEKEGTLAKSKMLEEMHPDVAKTVWKFNRWHHQVDYKPFKSTNLSLKAGVSLTNQINNYGMKIITVKK
jgi:hypothetical protein